MLVGADAVVGTIGGGHLELKAIAAARALLAARRGAAAASNAIALGPSLGQCCGGALTLRFAPLDAEALAALASGRRRASSCSSTAPATSAARSWRCWPRSTAACTGSTSATPNFRHGPLAARTSSASAVDAIEAEVRHAPAGRSSSS